MKNVEWGSRGVVMKIRVAILDKDSAYLDRIASVFNAKYADKLVVYSFTDKDTALSQLSKSKIDVFIASEQFDIEVEKLSGKCGFAYFVENHEIDSVKNQKAICKFQKVDLIYKQILGIYSEMATNISGLKSAEETCSLIAFTSPCGGVGTSTLAAAYSVACAKQGKRVLYLNLETYGSSDVFFCADGQFDMSDIIYALKSKKSNVMIKLESCVKQDASGVYFFSQPKVVLDFMEMGYEEIDMLIQNLTLSGKYDYIVMDLDFELNGNFMHFLEKMHKIVMVGDGSVISNLKIFRAYGAIQMLEENMDISVMNRMALIYNKFSNKTGRVLEALDIKTLGGAPRYEHATVEQLLKQLSGMTIFEQLI